MTQQSYEDIERALAEVDCVLDRLSIAQLRYLNRKIIDRIRLLQKVGDLHAMSRLSVTDRVAFTDRGRRVLGTVIKLNVRTVTVITDDHQQWNIAPSLVRKVERA